jgi:cytochrome b6-f complex iron-sulfur subunit
MTEETADAQVQGEALQEGENLSVNRREFLNLAWLASLGFLTVGVSGVSIVFAYPRFKEGEFGGIFRFGTVADLPDVNTPPLNYPKVKLWVSNSEDGLRGLYKVCPHLGCLYAWNDQEFKFICPCHGSQYEHDGDWIQGPAPRSLDRFIVRIVDEATNEILAETPVDGGAIEIPDNPNAAVLVDTGARIQGETHE